MLTENALPRTSTHATFTLATNGSSGAARPLFARGRRWLVPAGYVLFFGALAAAGVYYRTEISELFQPPAPSAGAARVEPVAVLGPGVVGVQAGTPLEQRLRIVNVAYEKIDYPLLCVTGYVMARLGAGRDHAESRWDFAAPEIATAYGDWVKAKADVAFAEQQLIKVKNLVAANVKYKEEVVQRFENLAKIGAEAKRDWAAAQFDLEQAKLQGLKDTHEAEKAVSDAVRNRGLLERQLLQAGVDPDVVAQAKDGLVLAVADVPEAKVGQVRPGQGCEARFFSYQDQAYKGRVGRLGPSVSREKRTLRVTFELADPSGKLLPGMFGDIGLGTESRQVLTVPAEAVLHAGKADYVLREEAPGRYQAVDVVVDEPRVAAPSAQDDYASDGRLRIPVLEGLRAGDRVVGSGSILLKPAMVKALANGNGH